MTTRTKPPNPRPPAPPRPTRIPEHRLRDETPETGARDGSPVILGTSECHRAMMAFEREGRPISPRLKEEMQRLADRLLAVGRRYQDAANGIRTTGN